MNSDDIICIRYIDDFLILGPTLEKTQKAFKKALGILKDLKLSAYAPGGEDDKAEFGRTNRAFNFLGCSIGNGFVHPSQEAQTKLKKKIRIILNEGISNIEKDISRTNYADIHPQIGCFRAQGC